MEELRQYINKEIKKYYKLMHEEGIKSTNYLVYKGQVIAYKKILERLKRYKYEFNWYASKKKEYSR